MYYKGYVLSEYYDDIIASKLRVEASETFPSYDAAKKYIDQNNVIPMPFLISSFQIAYWVFIAIATAMKLLQYDFAKAGNKILTVFLILMTIWVVWQIFWDLMSFGKHGKDKKKKFLNRHCMDCDFKDFLKIVFSEIYLNLLSILLTIIGLIIF